MTVYLISAVGNEGQIGLNGKLPWHDRKDLLWFREQTMGQVVVVGPKTAETLPDLPGRTVHVSTQQEDPIEVLRQYPGKDIYVAGGAWTYWKWAPYVDRYLISRVDYSGPADTFFPRQILPGFLEPGKDLLRA